MFEIAYTMHRGKVCRQQQDCILIDGAIHQVPVLPITAATLAADEVLLAVADGVASSGGKRRIAPQQASRIVLEELVRAVRERPDWLQDGFVANRHVRQVQARLSDKLADHPELSTGQNFQSPQEILKFPAEVEGDVTEEVEAMAEEGLEGSLQSFLKGTGEFSS